jgi:hypothetical protein
MMISTLLLLIASGVIFLLYFHTLSPSIAGGDSGEIVAEGCHLGTAHPPGYPLITVFIHFLSKLPQLISLSEPTTVAYWVNVSSSLFTSIACFFVGLVINEYSLYLSVGSVVAMFFFAFSPLIWQYAITAEVFSLNTMLTSIILFLTIKFSKTRNIDYALLGAFVCGLALCNQHTIILFEVPLIFWMLFLLRRQLLSSSVLFGKLSLAFILGFAGYLYLPLAVLFNHRHGSWGYVGSFSGFLHHFLRKDYGTFQLFSGKTGRQNENMWERHVAYWKDFTEVQSYSSLFQILVFIGAIVSIFIALRYDSSYKSDEEANINQPSSSSVEETEFHSPVSSSGRKNKKGSKLSASQPIKQLMKATGTSPISQAECRWTPAVLIFTEMFYLCVFHTLSNLPLSDKLLYGVHQRFWMQPNILLFIWIGIGINGIILFFTDFVLSKSPSILKNGLKFLLLLGAVFLSFQQYTKNYELSNQSDAIYFHNYAKAILSPLPANSILLVNYDQQWTSIRYLQICEKYRPDIITLQLSMMSYKWFEEKRSLYSNILFDNSTQKSLSINFPGTYLTYQGSPMVEKENAFTLISFLKSNMITFKNHIYLGGKLGHFDIQLNEHYELIPIGLVSQFFPMDRISTEINPLEYCYDIIKSWKIVMSDCYNYTFPSEKKYPEETWEWTIVRDTKDRLVDSSSYLLATAIPYANSDPRPLIESVYLVESAVYMEGESEAPTSLLKNLGLAHVHLIQNKVLTGDDSIQPKDDYLRLLEKISWPENGVKWKDWSANRFQHAWGLFLQRKDAAQDPQYTTIKNLYEKVTQAAAGNNPQQQRSNQQPLPAAHSSSEDVKEGKTKRKKKTKGNKSEL